MHNINYHIENFRIEIENIYKAYRFSNAGLYNYKRLIKDDITKNPGNFHIVDEECEIEIKFTEEELEEANHLGFYQKIIAGNTIAMIYNLWEDKYRPKFAKYLNYEETKDLKNDFFGELGKIRHAIVHTNYSYTSKLKNLQILKSFIVNKQLILSLFEVDYVYKQALKALEEIEIKAMN